MAYLSNSDIEIRMGTALYVQLSDDTGSGSADETVIDQARQSAESTVNSYLARRYAVPIDLSAHPELADVLKATTLDLAEFNLHARRLPIPEDVTAKRNATLRWLDKVANGKVVLPAETAVENNSAEGITGQYIGTDRVMSRDSLEDL